MFLRFLLFLLALATALIVLATDDAPALQRDATLSPTAIAQARWLFLSNDPRRLKAGEVRRVGIPASLFDQGVNYLASRSKFRTSLILAAIGWKKAGWPQPSS